MHLPQLKTKKSVILLGKSVIKFSTIMLFAAFLSACSSNSALLHKEITVSPKEQEQIKTSTVRHTTSLDKVTNLNDFTFPTEDQLLDEAGFLSKDRSQYNESLKILKSWALNTLSASERKHLSQNCNLLVGNYHKEFPLNETTLACAGYWLEQKYFIRKGIISIDGTPIPAKKRDTKSVAKSSLTDAQKQNWKNFKKMSFTDAFAELNLDSYDAARKYIAKALKVSPVKSKCAYAGAEGALILRLEPFLSTTSSAFKNMDKLYKHIQHCLVPDQNGSEKVHLRIGLLNLLIGDKKLAKIALKRALLEKDPEESSRSLFWLGVLYRNNQNQKQAKTTQNPHWERLFKEVPLSYASLVASQQMGRDPMASLVPDESILIQERENGGWTPHNLEAFVFELFYAKADNQRAIPEAAQAWSDFITQTSTIKTPSFLLFWSLADNAVARYRNSIVTLNRYNKFSQERKISPTLLTLQFPIPEPYLESILKNEKNTDPALVLSLMRQESAFDPLARSTANARGLMQLLPSTARKTSGKNLNSIELYKPDTNITIGMNYLEELLDKYDGQIEYALAAYNAGPLNVDGWRTRVPMQNMFLFCDFIPFSQTRSYVSIILRNYYWYKRIFELFQTESSLLQKVQKAGERTKYKSDAVLALIAATTNLDDYIDPKHKEILNRIYIFGPHQIRASNP